MLALLFLDINSKAEERIRQLSQLSYRCFHTPNSQPSIRNGLEPTAHAAFR